MHLSETHLLSVPLAQAWESLNDLALLESAIPGCDSLVEIAPDIFEAVLTLSVGPLASPFTVHLRRAEIDAPQGCTLHFSAETLAGGGVGRADMRLSVEDDVSTTLRVDVDARIHGPIGQFAGVLVDIAAQRMVTEFFDRLRAALPMPPGQVPGA